MASGAGLLAISHSLGLYCNKRWLHFLRSGMNSGVRIRNRSSFSRETGIGFTRLEGQNWWGSVGHQTRQGLGRPRPILFFSPSHPFVPGKAVTAEIVISLGVRCYVRASSGLRKNNLGHKHHCSTFHWWCSIMADTAFQARSLVFFYPSYSLSLPSLQQDGRLTKAVMHPVPQSSPFL